MKLRVIITCGVIFRTIIAREFWMVLFAHAQVFVAVPWNVFGIGVECCRPARGEGSWHTGHPDDNNPDDVGSYKIVAQWCEVPFAGVEGKIRTDSCRRTQERALGVSDSFVTFRRAACRQGRTRRIKQWLLTLTSKDTANSSWFSRISPRRMLILVEAAYL